MYLLVEISSKNVQVLKREIYPICLLSSRLLKSFRTEILKNRVLQYQGETQNSISLAVDQMYRYKLINNIASTKEFRQETMKVFMKQHLGISSSTKTTEDQPKQHLEVSNSENAE